MSIRIFTFLFLGLWAVTHTYATYPQDSEESTGSVQDESTNIVVYSAYRDPFLTETPDTISASHVELLTSDVNASSVLSVLEATPGVFANGQGGMFQTYSIRGSAKNRIRTLVEGIPIITERRAGVSSSFIDPLMIESMDVLRGPVSTFYGSGALGGAINFFLANKSASHLSIGAQDQGNGFYTSYIYSDEEINLGVSHRDFDKTDSAEGDLLNNAFSSTNAYFRRSWEQNDFSYEFFWLETEAKNIGKSNARYNVSRDTIYPSETHSLLKFQVKHDSGWLTQVYYHPNDLTTDNDDLNGNLTRTENNSDDLGASFQKETDLLDSLAENIDTQWGIDWFSRKNVRAFEIEFDRNTGLASRSEVIQNGRLDDIALFMSAIIKAELTYWHLGTRYNVQNSEVANSTRVTDEAVTTFIGMNHPLSERIKLQINVASGFRFPTLSERFFSGTTARGEQIAPVNLDKESSLNLDIALSWQSDNHHVHVNGFVMDVDNYIERVRLDTGVRTYVNLNNGQISGSEIVYQFTYQQHNWDFSYTNYQGKADNGDFLADIPTDEFQLGYSIASDNWRFNLDWQYRLSKDDIGSGELPSNSYNVLDMGFEYQFNQNWQLSISMDNALDELYISGNDDLDTYATGRTVGVAIHWQE